MRRACNWKVKKEQLFLAYDTRYEISDIGLGMRRNIEYRQAIVYVLVLVNPSFYSKYFTQAYMILLIKTEAKFSIWGEFDHWKDSVRFMLVIGQCNRSARIMYARCCGAFLGVNFVAVFFLIYFGENLFSTETWISYVFLSILSICDAHRSQLTFISYILIKCLLNQSVRKTWQRSSASLNCECFHGH